MIVFILINDKLNQQRKKKTKKNISKKYEIAKYSIILNEWSSIKSYEFEGLGHRQ